MRLDVTLSKIRVEWLRTLLGMCAGFLSFVLTCAAAELPHADRAKLNILVLGDSLAAGYGLDPAEAFPALLQEKVNARGWAHKVVNAGLSGDTTAGGVRRLDWLLKQRVDILILELGGNDGLRGIQPETTRSNLVNIIRRARERYPELQVVMAGMRMPPNLGAAYVERFQNIFPEVAKENGAKLVPFLLEGVGGSRELNQADQIHPTARGQEVVAENVWRVLEPLLNPGGDGNASPSPIADRGAGKGQ